MRNHCGCLALTIVAATMGDPAQAEDRKWSFRFEPMYVQVYGHDQHVLTIHEIDTDPSSLDDKSAVNLDTDTGIAYRGEFQRSWGKWGVGADLFWFVTSQKADSRTAAADGAGGTVDQVVFEVADQLFTSTDPGEVLFYDLLEDTDLELWTFDVYGTRTLAEQPHSRILLRFGLRNGDFDNDYRAVLGIRDAGGSKLDASSNYDRMMGPLVGLAGDIRQGRHTIEGAISQSVLIGKAALTSMSRGFTGPFTDATTFDDEERFRRVQDVAIPVTELRIAWSYRITERVALGAGAFAATWWDVSVPPGIVPLEGGDDVLHENTLVLFGLSGSVIVAF